MEKEKLIWIITLYMTDLCSCCGVKTSSSSSYWETFNSQLLIVSRVENQVTNWPETNWSSTNRRQLIWISGVGPYLIHFPPVSVYICPPPPPFSPNSLIHPPLISTWEYARAQELPPVLRVLRTTAPIHAYSTCHYPLKCCQMWVRLWSQLVAWGIKLGKKCSHFLLIYFSAPRVLLETS